MRLGPTTQLALGWLALGGALASVAGLHPTHATSPDSAYYLESAQNLLAGRGYVATHHGRVGWNGLFPPLYPALTFLAMAPTGLNALVASKLVNWLAIGLSVALWSQRVGAGRAGWLPGIWATGELLRVAAYTWSETVFLVLLAEWVWQLHHLRTSPSLRSGTGLLAVGLALFGTRYMGAFVFGLAGLLALLPRPYGLRRLPHPGIPTHPGNRHPRSLPADTTFARLPALRRSLLGVAGAGAVGCGLYLGLNWHKTGSPWGGPRLVPTESATQLLSLTGRGLLNAFLLFRDLPTTVSIDGLTLVGVGLQLGWLALTYRAWRQRRASGPLRGSSAGQRSERSENAGGSLTPLARLFGLVGGAYLVALLALRWISPFDAPNARLLAPTTFCWLWAGALHLSQRRTGRRSLRPYALAGLLGSWLHLLPLRSPQPPPRSAPAQSQHSIISRSPVRAAMRTSPSWAASLLDPVR